MTTVPMSGAGRIHVATRSSMAAFCPLVAANLNNSQGRAIGAPLARVVDHTGVDGIYDVRFEYTGVMSMHVTTEQLDEMASDPGPNLFTALEKQVGLKLRRIADVKVDVLVIDHAEKVPAEN